MFECMCRFATGFVALAGLLGASAASAQVVVPGPTGGLVPQIPAQGQWLQVLTVTENWIVLQNDRGQQFPVSADAIQTFVMRWPTSVERLDANCLVEVTGLDLGTNRVAADHADVYRGNARSLVTPAVLHLVGFNRVVTPFDLERQNTFGINLQYILSPQELAMPRRLHVVAAPVNLDPIVLAIPGNNAVTVVPTGAMSMTDVTPGSFTQVRPGDLAYAVTRRPEMTPRSLNLGFLVIYKDMPFRR